MTFQISFIVIKRGTNRKLVYDFLLVGLLCSDFCGLPYNATFTTDMDTKRATSKSKCIATALVSQLCWISLSLCVKITFYRVLTLTTIPLAC